MSLSGYFELVQVIIPFLFSEISWFFKQKIQTFRYQHLSKFKKIENEKRIEIIGASFAGLEVVRNLLKISPKEVQIIIIEPRSDFNYCFAFPRFSVVDTNDERKAFLPFDLIFKSFSKKSKCKKIIHLQAFVQEFHNGFLILDNDEKRLSYVYAIIACGTTQSPPAHLISHQKEEACKELKQFQAKIKHSHQIAIIGGGAVGVELATDIKTFYENKQVTILHSRETLLNGFPNTVGEFVYRKLVELGIHVILETRFNNSEKERENYDLVINCVGQKPNSSSFQQSNCMIDPASQFLKVSPSLQVFKKDESLGEVLNNVYALGDIANTGGPKMARAASLQARVVCINVLNSITGISQNKIKYTPNTPVEGALLLTLGKDSSLLHFQTSAGKEVLIERKGEPEDLNVKKAWKFYGIDC